MSVTDISYNRLVRWLVPVRLRKDRLLAFLSALTYPVANRLYPGFKAWEGKSWSDLKYQSGQVAYLEYVLNEYFGRNPTNDITIGPGVLMDGYHWLYTEAENQPMWLNREVDNDPMYVFTEQELSRQALYIYDFVVNVPTAVSPEEKRLRALIDRYKRDSKTYHINYF